MPGAVDAEVAAAGDQRALGGGADHLALLLAGAEGLEGLRLSLRVGLGRAGGELQKGEVLPRKQGGKANRTKRGDHAVLERIEDRTSLDPSFEETEPPTMVMKVGRRAWQ